MYKLTKEESWFILKLSGSKCDLQNAVMTSANKIRDWMGKLGVLLDAWNKFAHVVSNIIKKSNSQLLLMLKARWFQFAFHLA